VASAATKRLGYYQGGVEIIVDRDTFRAGETAHVMIVAPSSGSHVLLGVEAEEIFESRLLKLDGDAKLVEIAIDERHIPNFFITAHLVADLQLLGDTENIVVPPVRQFIDVDVTADAKEALPGGKGRMTVTTRDADGKPVAAEVALAVADASVEAIQKSLSDDPRKFFYGSKRPHRVTTTSSFATRQYLRLLPREKSEEDEGQREEKSVAGRAAMAKGVVGGRVSDAMAEAITVTAEAPALMPPPAPALQSSQDFDASWIQPVTVRSDFRSTALWIPDVMTGPSGTATVDVSYPESLTTWNATATAVTAQNQVGRGTAATRTRKALMVRLQGPRFLVAGDEATISAVVNNGTNEPMKATVSLDLAGLEVVSKGNETVDVAPNADARVDWKVRARSAGAARLRVTGRAATDSDAMERTMPVFEHGIDKLVAVSGRTRGSDTSAFLEIPKERRLETTDLVVQVTPSLAVTMLDALPYLVEFPYGCTEQTMSRFLPAVITLKTLGDLGLSREDAAWRIFGGIEERSATATHPNRTGGIEKLDAVIRTSLDRLYDFQHSDGGWGWWKDGDSDPYMTAYVVWGLALSRDAGQARGAMLDRGVVFLQKALVERESALDEQAWMLHALGAARKGAAPQEFEAKAIENLWTNRDRLRPYSRALFALALQAYGSGDRAKVVIRNLENGVQLDRTPDKSIVSRGGSDAGAETLATARWGERGVWWRWWDGPVESTAFALRALVAVDPKHPLVEPAMNWLVKNRRGAQWSSTKETAIAVLALNDYVRASGELASEGSYEIQVNGTAIAKQSVTPATVLRAPSRYRVDPALVRDGRNEVRIVRSSGTANLYFGAEARFFSLEEPVTAAGTQLFVKRQYFRLAGRPTLLAGYVYDRVPLGDGASIASGERIEVLVQVETKNDLEYLIFEDLKPAGFEAVALQSGESLFATKISGAAPVVEPRVDQRGVVRGRPTGGAVLHQELRDRKVAIFADRLDQGIWEFRYTLRAETPGTFHALPLLGSAMYVPEIRANGEEVRVTVLE
ncbi:MAG: alpha-2-macroglobulin family protein, partial [Thermoanaerobaculia bacterium]